MSFRLRRVTTEWLKKAELFQTLDESRLNVLLLHSSVESFPEGKEIFRQGDGANHLYVLIEGAIDLSVKTGEKVDFLTSKIEKDGALFGMPSLIEPFRYNVTATSLKPSKVLIMDAVHIRKTMEEDPKLGMEVMKKLALIYFNRLNEIRSGVSNLVKIFRRKNP